MELKTCSMCGTRVVPAADGNCPSCRRPVSGVPASADGSATAPASKAAIATLASIRAIEIVREIAKKTNEKSVLAMVGKSNPRHLGNARASYATEMTDDEVPLAMIDTSFLQNGKTGILLTNSRLYSSTGPQSVPLCDIMAATLEKPSDFQAGCLRILLGPIYVLLMANKLTPKLVVNGEVMYAGAMNFDFWGEVLLKLASACHE